MQFDLLMLDTALRSVNIDQPDTIIRERFSDKRLYRVNCFIDTNGWAISSIVNLELGTQLKCRIPISKFLLAGADFVNLGVTTYHEQFNNILCSFEYDKITHIHTVTFKKSNNDQN